MSKLDKVDLPELPKGYRWHLKKNPYTGNPMIVLEKKEVVGWFSKKEVWTEVQDRSISYSVWKDMDVAIAKSAQIIMEDQIGSFIAEDYYGTTP